MDMFKKRSYKTAGPLMGKKHKQRLWALLVTFAVLLTFAPALPVQADSNTIDYNDRYTYTGDGISGTYVSNSVTTRRFVMTDGYIAYCVDENIFINTSSQYIKVALDHAESFKMFDNHAARPDKIRAILTYAWDKKHPDEIAAIQYALWHEMHGTNIPGDASQDIKNIYNELISDSQTPPISADEIETNSFSLTAPNPAGQAYIYNPATIQYSFDFKASSDENIVFSVKNQDNEGLDEDDYEVVHQGDDNYRLILKDVTGPSSYTLTAQTLRHSAVEAFVFISLDDNDDSKLNHKSSQTVAGIKLSKTTQSESFTVELYGTATGSLNLSGTKVLNGRDLKQDEFSFALYAGTSVTGEPLATAKNDGLGNFSFPVIDYDQDDVGTKTYTVLEQKGSLGGISYDAYKYTVRVTITNNGDGSLSVTPKLSGKHKTLKFTNTYKATGNLLLAGSKELTGRKLKAGEFSFALYAGSSTKGKPLATATNDDSGDFSFPAISYGLRDVGTKTYTVVEQKGSLGGVSYDRRQYKVTVKITDNGDGTLSAKPQISGKAKSLKFSNKYKASGSLTLSGSKELAGRDLKADEFSFALYSGTSAKGKPLATATNDDSGNFSFPAISYGLRDVGTKTYTVVEEAGLVPGVSYAKNVYTLIVNITDNGDGTLDISFADESDDPAALVFSNSYAASGSLQLSGKKSLSGRAINDAEFSFGLYEADDLLDTATNDTDGNFNFTIINYQLADVGSKTYTVKEIAGSAGGVTYDEFAYTVEVDITDNGDGSLGVVATFADTDEISFSNSYAATGSLVLGGKKSLSGRAMNAGEFSFGLYDADDLLDTANNDVDGNFSFAAISYSLADVGRWTYTIKEIAGSAGGVSYDEKEYTVELEVSDKGDGTLDVMLMDTDAGNISFSNTYTASGSLQLNAKKVLPGRDLADGEFSFALYEKDDLLATVTNDATGQISFPSISYSLNDLGKKSYTVKEIIGSAEGIIYDDTVYTVDVEIADNGDGTLDVAYSFVDADEMVFVNGYFVVIDAVEDIPLAVAGIKLVKQVQNLTRGGAPADLAAGYTGDSFRYTITIENTGSTDLAGVILTDDKAVAGTAVRNQTADKMEKWQEDEGTTYLIVGHLAPGERVIYSYDYVSQAADSGQPHINTAHVSGEVPGTDDNSAPVTVEDEDQATVAVDDIPKTGEARSLPLIGYGLLLAVGALMWMRRKFSRNTQE